MKSEAPESRRTRSDSNYPLVVEMIGVMGICTKKDLMDVLGISGNALSRHLRSALKNGEVQLAQVVRIPGMAGRPSLRYQLTPSP